MVRDEHLCTLASLGPLKTSSRPATQIQIIFLPIVENISFEEFKERDVAEMAKLITTVKREKPQTKSRHSEQAWIENVSERSDSIIAAIAER